MLYAAIAFKWLSVAVEEEQGHKKCPKMLKIEIFIKQILACLFHVGETGRTIVGQTDITPCPLGADNVLEEIDTNI